MGRNDSPRDEPRYIISVAAQMVNLHPQTLRHYERVGLVVPARSRGESGLRLYSDNDIERLRRITSLIEDLGVNLAGVEVILNMSQQIAELQARLQIAEEEFAVEVERLKRAYLEDKARRRPRLPLLATREPR